MSNLETALFGEGESTGMRGKVERMYESHQEARAYFRTLLLALIIGFGGTMAFMYRQSVEAQALRAAVVSEKK